jgi:hypothetical protein
MAVRLSLISLLSVTFLCPTIRAQETTAESVIDAQTIINSARLPASRELTVLAPTLSPAEIDQAVLNRLMQEIAKTPDTVINELRIDNKKLQDIFVSLSNARNFINTNEISSIRTMCNTFKKSKASGEQKIAEALAAYELRSSYTKRFIASFYHRLIWEIEAGLSPQALVSFKSYMDDRRRRMATAGNATTGIPTQNVKSGREAVEFHCGSAR